MNLDETKVQVAMVGAVAHECLTTKPGWMSTVLKKTMAKYKAGTGNTLISIYTMLLDGMPTEVVAVLTTLLGENPVCVIGYTDDILGYGLFGDKVLSDIRRELNFFHHKF